VNKCTWVSSTNGSRCDSRAVRFFKTKRENEVFAGTRISVMARCEDHISHLTLYANSMRVEIDEEEYTVALVMES
jgi:hypothetical protein